VAKRT